MATEQKKFEQVGSTNNSLDKNFNHSKYPQKNQNKKDPNSWEYKKRAIQSASSLKLIIMLYEEAINCLEESKKYIADFKTYDLFNKKLFKAIDITKELRFSLDMSQGEISKNLNSLYEYINKILVQAGIDKKTDSIDESIGILEGLLSSWRKIEENKDDNTLKNQTQIPSSRFDGGFSIKG